MITITKFKDNIESLNTLTDCQNGKEAFAIYENKNILGCCYYNEHTKKIISYYSFSDFPYNFVVINLTKAILNHFDKLGFTEVFCESKNNIDILLSLGFEIENDILKVNLKGYFDKKCKGEI